MLDLRNKSTLFTRRGKHEANKIYPALETKPFLYGKHRLNGLEILFQHIDTFKYIEIRSPKLTRTKNNIKGLVNYEPIYQ